jgi:membrane-bound ClpP family serine protease
LSIEDVDQNLVKFISYSQKEKNLVGYIAIDDRTSAISQSTWIYVKSALDYYKKVKPAFIILKLNTPGGEVFAAQQISDALQEIDTQLNIPVVAFIDNWAISAGAMIAYSCRYITCVKDASMGAAAPVIVGEGGQMVEASEKVNSAIRTDFANRARFFDRNADIAEAMVDKDVILVLRYGKVVRLDSEDQIRTKGANPDKVISNKGKLLTLDAKQMIEYNVADILLKPAKLTPITSEEESAGKWPFSKELLSTYPFFSKIPNAQVDSYQMDWRTQFFALLAMPLVSSLLMLGLLLGFYIEFNTPGFGLPGAVGITCLALIIISSLSLEIASWLEVIFIFIGIGMLVTEVFLLPTGGILGIIGAIFFIGGLFAVMIPGVGTIDFEFDTQTFNAAGQEFMKRLAWLCGTLVVSFIVMGLLARHLSPNLAGLNRLILQGNEQDAADGYIAGEKPETLPGPGSRGIVMATLRPAGKVVIDDKIYDAVTAGAFLDKGEKIVVEKLDGSVIVVNKDRKGEGS